MERATTGRDLASAARAQTNPTETSATVPQQVDAMDEAAVQQLITTELTKSIAPAGVFDTALTAIKQVGEKAAEDVKHLTNRVTALDKIEAELDKEFPFRTFERDCDPTAWALGWKKLMIDRDHLANLAAQMGDPSVAQTMALWAQHQADPHINQLKDAVSFKNAPKTRWKELCLESHGGSHDKFRGVASCSTKALTRTKLWLA